MSGNPHVYQDNRPTCAGCGGPIGDSDRRENRAGKVYHTDCYEKGER